MGSGKVISSLSGARIQNPKNRLHPLSFYATKYSVYQSSGYSVSPQPSPSNPSGNWKYNTINNAQSSFLTLRQKHDTPPKLPNKQRSLSVTPSELNGKLQMLHCGNDKSNSADGVIQNMNSNCGRFATNSLPRGTKNKDILVNNEKGTTTRNSKLSRVTSDPSLSPCFERRNATGESTGGGTTTTTTTINNPPPKPSRIPSLPGGVETIIPNKENNNNFYKVTSSYQASGSDSGNGSGDSAQSSATGDSNEVTTPCGTGGGTISHGVIIKNPRYHYDKSNVPNSASTSTLKGLEFDPSTEEYLVNLLPKIDLGTAFDVENFQTLLLPTLENKPVDSSTLQCVKNMLRENGSRILANHMTRVDLEITIGEKTGIKNWSELGLGISSGIEMCSLPQGQQVRLDIIER